MGIGCTTAASDNVQAMILQQRPKVGHEALWRLLILTIPASIGINADLEAERCQLINQGRHLWNIRQAIDANREYTILIEGADKLDDALAQHIMTIRRRYRETEHDRQ